jgi:REP element-mobilizing transposase RayT
MMVEEPAHPLHSRRHVRGYRVDEPGRIYHIRTSTEDNEPWLALPGCAEVFIESLLKWRSRLDFQLFAFVVMPEHVHVLCMPTETASLRRIVMDVKRHSGWRINQLLGRSGRFWREEFFDHWMRKKSQAARTVEYLHNNPVRRELAKGPEDYPHSSWHAWYRPQECSYQLDLDWW